MKELKLFYNRPAEDDFEGFEHYSLPLGCGWFGANVFGLIENERIFITENSVLTKENLTGAADIRIQFPHTADKVENYERNLILGKAVSYVKYDLNGVHYEREYFTSHPDRVMAMRFTADKKGSLEFTVDLQVPYICEFGNELGLGRTGEVSADGNVITSLSHLEYYNIFLASQIRVLSDGKVTTDGKTVSVSGASEAVVYFSCETNYVMAPETFAEPDPQKKIPEKDPTPNVSERLQKLESKGLVGYNDVLSDHIADYKSLFDRVDLHIEGGSEEMDNLPTDELIWQYQVDYDSPYLETLYFQFGRYMLICSSRVGSLPAHLQGIWNFKQRSAWGSGYWHNINVQMNYWPIFTTNLGDLFLSYSNFNNAFRVSERTNAVEFAKRLGTYTDENDNYGWAIGTSVRPYRGSFGPGNHSGPGTGGLTSKLFWDWWDFTRDKSVLEKSVSPVIHELSYAFQHAVKEYDGEYLSIFSASPEIELIGHGKHDYYTTVGCAFDQMMIWENGKQDLKCAELLGYTDDTIEKIKNQIDHYHPVEIGRSGQIKEFREEKHYGDIGEKDHRHISQLIGLMPGTVITKETPAWNDAAKRTLTFRGDYSLGWSIAHRFNCWARTGDGNRAYDLFHNLLKFRTMTNLWNGHDPFQLDGNMGGTSGVAEMLLQSHAGYIDILPALPDVWKTGSYKGLMARGNFCVDVSWENKNVNSIVIKSVAGEEAKIRYSKISGSKITDDKGNDVHYTVIAEDMISFATEAGTIYTVNDIPITRKIPTPKNLTVSGSTPLLSWMPGSDDSVTYTIYKNTDSNPDYEVVVEKLRATDFMDFAHEKTEGGYTMYKIVAVPDDHNFSTSDGAVCVIEDK